ncbi:MAG: hypothetical protein ACJ786_06280 [Catenulispora sp.]
MSGARLRRWAAFIALLLIPVTGAAVGCDRSPEASSGTNHHRAPRPATTQPTTKPELPTSAAARTAAGGGTTVAKAVKPAGDLSAYLYFEWADNQNPADASPDVLQSAAAQGANGWGRPLQFPPARLRLVGKGDEPVTALLFSDDPKEAINKEWAGDRFYLQFPLQNVTDVQKVDGAEWWFQASASEREETPNGIFMKGDRFHFEPFNVRVRLEGKPINGGGISVQIAGQFFMYDTANPNTPPRLINVRGILLPKVETRE